MPWCHCCLSLTSHIFLNLGAEFKGESLGWRGNEAVKEKNRQTKTNKRL